jgi:hypothetical protein
MNLCKSVLKSKEQICKTLTEKQNKLYSKKFAKTPFNKRLLFVPHCMRNTSVCRAVEKDGWYFCAECGCCKIGELTALAKKLNYQGSYVLKGGRTITKIIKEQKPQAVCGVACSFEGEQAFSLLENENLPIQFVPLTKDGCSATDVDLQEAEKVLNQKE